MIVLSTLVAAIVEVLNEVRKFRERHLAYMVGAVFDEYIWPKFKDALPVREEAIVEAARDPGTRISDGALAGKLPFAAMQPGPGKTSARWGLLVLILFVGAVLYFTGWTIVLAFYAIAIFFFWDKWKEKERFDYPGLPLEDPAQAVKLLTLDRLTAKATKSGGEAGLNEADQKTLNELLGDAALKSTYDRLLKRRRFIEEIVKVSKSVATNPTSAQTASAKRISATDFMAQLARSEFGAAIEKAAADELKTVLTEVARRFDAIGKDTLETFRERSRRWSVGVAFVLAFAVNVDAITIMDTFYRNPDLATKVEEAYADRLAEFGARIDAQVPTNQGDPKTPEDAEKDAKREFEALKKRIAETNKIIKEEVSGLAALGVPIGWERYPYCSVDSTKKLDAACREVVGILEQRIDKTIVDTLCRVANVPEGQKISEADKEKRRKVAADRLDEVRKLLRQASVKQSESNNTYSGPTFTAYKKAYLACLGSDDLVHSVKATWLAAELWVSTRRDPGLMAWIAGVLLGGALIGLGGPFWFDVYRRLSSVASIARSLGATAKPIPKTETQPAAATADPQTGHQPTSIGDAFVKVREADKALEKARAADRVLAAERSSEREPETRAHPELMPNGNVAT